MATFRKVENLMSGDFIRPSISMAGEHLVAEVIHVLRNDSRFYVQIKADNWCGILPHVVMLRMGDVVEVIPLVTDADGELA